MNHLEIKVIAENKPTDEKAQRMIENLNEYLNENWNKILNKNKNG